MCASLQASTAQVLLGLGVRGGVGEMSPPPLSESLFPFPASQKNAVIELVSVGRALGMSWGKKKPLRTTLPQAWWGSGAARKRASWGQGLVTSFLWAMLFMLVVPRVGVARRLMTLGKMGWSPQSFSSSGCAG